jgi:hypothetical protein
MPHWAFKNLDVLHHALGEEQKLHNHLDYKAVQLTSIKNQIVLGIGAEEAERLLTECRARMCKTCREHQLYTCDVPAGWSSNCTFLKRHAT